MNIIYYYYHNYFIVTANEWKLVNTKVLYNFVQIKQYKLKSTSEFRHHNIIKYSLKFVYIYTKIG